MYIYIYIFFVVVVVVVVDIFEIEQDDLCVYKCVKREANELFPPACDTAKCTRYAVGL